LPAAGTPGGGGWGKVRYSRHSVHLCGRRWSPAGGRCTTCFAGTRRLLEILRRIASGRGRSSDPEIMRLLADTMRYANCVHGQAAPTAVMSMFRFFEEELNEHLYNKRCPAKVCREQAPYAIALVDEFGL